LLYALSRLGRPDGTSSYFRLTTRPVDQALAAPPQDEAGREARRCAVLQGGYRLRAAAARPAVTLVGVGAVMPEVCAAADTLGDAGLACDVVCLTSPELIFRALQARQGLRDGDDAILEALFPADRAAPIVSVLDGHPHTLSFLSAIRCVPIACLGVDDFGQSGDVEDLYRYFGIDLETIVGAAVDLWEARA
jgi:pyruvate dehydrogenase E1 component